MLEVSFIQKAFRLSDDGINVSYVHSSMLSITMPGTVRVSLSV